MTGTQTTTPSSPAHAHAHGHTELSRCPMCGAKALSIVSAETSMLFAVSDVLVYKALEMLGKRIVREERGRFLKLDGQPWHVAHTLWTPSQTLLEKSLKGAWDVVPALLRSHGYRGAEPARVVEVLSDYVGALALMGEQHSLERLSEVFERRLDIVISVGGDGLWH